MTTVDDLHLQIVIDAIEQIVLTETLDGKKISEFELIRRLQSEPFALFNTDALRDTVTMFQTHFILFHCLYRIRQRWREEQRGDLSISALGIGWLRPSDSQHSGLPAPADPLERYYLDLDELKRTGQAEVEQLLGEFWRRFADITEELSPEADSESLHVMQLDTLPLSKRELRRQYFSCLHQCHPDKGGTEEDTLRLISAYQHLSGRIKKNSE